MISSRRLLAATLGALALATVLTADDHEFISTWRAPGAGPLNFAGRKVAAVLITDDHNLRVPAEEALAREITARGPIGVPAYRVIPKEELTHPGSAKGWFDRAGIEGLIVLRIVQTDTEKVYSAAVWSSGYYNYAWDYWDTGWTSVYPIGRAREQKVVTVETVLYDLSKGSPVWACVTRTTDPKDVQSYMKRLAKDIVTKLAAEGLVGKAKRS
jgi:hypothetical protein